MADRRIQEEFRETISVPPPSLRTIRSQGALQLTFARRNNTTSLYEARQSGCLRARVPRVARAERLCVVTLNTAGGLTGGDSLRHDLRWEAGTESTVTSQAAEKIYRAQDSAVRIETNIEVASGATAEWLPQETILFNRARLRRRSSAHLAADARFLCVEAIVFGRAAMGETVTSGEISDGWRVFREGRLIFADMFALDDDIESALQRKAIGAGANAAALLICVEQNVARLLSDLRSALENARGRAAASAWNGMLIARLLAPDSETLREDINLALGVLRAGLPAPRAWAC
ncbi:MAG: urease accessory protein UreD [Alphaproteobacteria bacterium]